MRLQVLCANTGSGTLTGTIRHAGTVQMESSGVDPSVISLPTGGGSLRSIGERFQPDPQTGCAKYAIPIELPAGRAGSAHPPLNLVYSSGKGNSPFGLGWELDIPEVKRSARLGIPQYTDTDEIIVGTVEYSYHDGRWRANNEDNLTLIARSPSADDPVWTAKRPDGVTQGFGEEKAAIVKANDGSGRCFTSKLTSHRDPAGGVTCYHYTRSPDSSLEVGAVSESYIERILLCNIRPDSDADFLIRVRV